MYTFRNKSEVEQMLPGIGIVKPNETVTTANKIENANFEAVSSEQASDQPASSQTQPTPQQTTVPASQPKGEDKE